MSADTEVGFEVHGGGGPSPERVPIRGIEVVDASADAVVLEASRAPNGAARVVLALHVGGVLHVGDPQFDRALNAADLVHADGAAVVLLARAAGARSIERAATTDIGIPIIEAVSRRLGRRARVALLGGPPGLAEGAARVMAERADAEVVLTVAGYDRDDVALLAGLRACAPDIIFVGLGMPREALWVHTHRDALPAAVVVTCGGWFGFLTGAERRAPVMLQKAGLEWTYRLAQDFPRLVGRYTRGAFTVLCLLPGQLRARQIAGRSDRVDLEAPQHTRARG